MLYFRESCLKQVAAVGCALLVCSSSASAEGKSLWQSFVDFFSPTSEVEGDGPLYDELRELDRKINRVEGKYARERRPMQKDRYKKELKQLHEEREALLKKIEAGKTAGTSSSSVVASSSSAKVASSSSVSSSSFSSSSEEISSSATELSSSSELVVSSAATDSVAASVVFANQSVTVVCKPDTVYVRDTVVVHDTLYVMLAPKPESAPTDASKK
ncbi:MAG: hypothetical protein SPL21_01520 [Fibrobacter sp.]|nr:hypothetical protein [Fibrobacter sp.]